MCSPVLAGKQRTSQHSSETRITCLSENNRVGEEKKEQPGTFWKKGASPTSCTAKWPSSLPAETVSSSKWAQVKSESVSGRITTDSCSSLSADWKCQRASGQRTGGLISPVTRLRIYLPTFLSPKMQPNGVFISGAAGHLGDLGKHTLQPPTVVCLQSQYCLCECWYVLKWVHTSAPVQWQQSAPLCPDVLPGRSRRPRVFAATLALLSAWLFHSLSGWGTVPYLDIDVWKETKRAIKTGENAKLIRVTCGLVGSAIRQEIKASLTGTSDKAKGKLWGMQEQVEIKS